MIDYFCKCSKCGYWLNGAKDEQPDIELISLNRMHKIEIVCGNCGKKYALQCELNELLDLGAPEG